MSKRVVYIDGRRDGYAPEQISDQTMTVREFIDNLESYPDDALVMLNNDSGYTFGIVDWSSTRLEEFSEYEDDEETETDDEEE